MKTKPAQLFLSSNRILEHYYNAKETGKSNIDLFKSLLFLDFHLQNSNMPDYIYKNILVNFIDESATINNLIVKAFESISQRFTKFRDKKIYINNGVFEEWQNLITQISPISILSFAIYNKCKDSFRLNIEDFISEIFKNSAIPCVYNPEIEDLIANKGLIDIHIHLNGTTEVDHLWQDALLYPSKFFNNIQKSLMSKNKMNVLEQYLQISNLVPADLYRLLKKASKIRDELTMKILNIDLRNGVESCHEHNSLLFPDKIHPWRNIRKNIPAEFNCIQYEALFLTEAFRRIDSEKDDHFAYLLHHYLLIYSFFNKLLVQQISQIGFDQFQKITLNELREYSEKKYEKRYKQLKGMYNDKTNIEGRFAPKDNSLEMAKLLKSIISPHKKNKQKEDDKKHLPFNLSLVCHFIKFEDHRYKSKEDMKNIITFRDIQLREILTRNLNILLPMLKRFDGYMVGFDAAGNELNARPEVFSPVFRKLRFLGFNNFTFHVGEDFVHLLSGIRSVYEALEFLELREGDRIGHGTAIGINPELWLKSIGDKIIIETGEWLDNLVFMYYMIKKYNIEYNSGIFNIIEEIKKYFRDIYDFSADNIEISDMVDAWELRKHDPFLSLERRTPSILEEFDTIELSLINELKLINQDNDTKTKAFKIFEKYNEGEVIKKYKKLIEIDISKLIDIDFFLKLQKTVLQELINKRIAIESMLTSNLRISFYNNYSEHHIFRWLNIGSSDLPRPIICLGSDDPGIFATNIRNEFSHVYLELLNKNKSIDESMDIITNINNNNRIFAFK